MRRLKKDYPIISDGRRIQEMLTSNKPIIELYLFSFSRYVEAVQLWLKATCLEVYGFANLS